METSRWDRIRVAERALQVHHASFGALHLDVVMAKDVPSCIPICRINRIGVLFAPALVIGKVIAHIEKVNSRVRQAQRRLGGVEVVTRAEKVDTKEISPT